MSIDPADITALYRQQADAPALAINMLVNEVTLRWDDLTFAASSVTVNPIGAVANPGRDETESDFPGTLLFSGTQDNVLAGTLQMPHCWAEGTIVRPHIHWSKPAGGAGDDVTWQIYTRILNRGAAPGNWVGPVAGVMEINHNGIADAEAITSFGAVAMTGMPVSTNLAWRLYRRGSSDVFGGTARLIEFDIHYQVDSRGSSREYAK
jgi:hypothetical protein